MSKRSLDELATLLGHRDQRVRQNAQFELVARNAPLALSKLTTADHPQLVRLHAFWGLGQLSKGATIEPSLWDADAEIRAQAAKVLGNLRHAAASERFVALLKDESPRVRFFAAMGLGKIGEKIDLSAYESISADKVIVYNHPGNKLASMVAFSLSPSASPVCSGLFFENFISGKTTMV